VTAVFQYTFRDDPLFPVGLTGPELGPPFRVYGMWLALARARAAGSAPPAPSLACGQ
jgi:hypothetical protein